MPLPATLTFRGSATPEEVAEVEDAFRSVGVEPSAGAARRELGAGAWTLAATLPVGAFLTALVEQAAADAWRRLAEFVGRLRRARRDEAGAPGRLLVLTDRESGLQVVLEPDLPPEAFRQLLALDLSAYRHGPLHYDASRGRWRSELDEWERGSG